MLANTLHRFPKHIKNEFLNIYLRLGNTNEKATVVTEEVKTVTTQAEEIDISLGKVAEEVAPTMNEITTIANVDLGIIPIDYVFEELKCIVTIPAPEGTIFKVVDQNDNVIVGRTEIDVTRVGSSTVNVNKIIRTKTILTGIFEGEQGGTIEMIFLTKIWEIK